MIAPVFKRLLCLSLTALLTLSLTVPAAALEYAVGAPEEGAELLAAEELVPALEPLPVPEPFWAERYADGEQDEQIELLSTEPYEITVGASTFSSDTDQTSSSGQWRYYAHSQSFVSHSASGARGGDSASGLSSCAVHKRTFGLSQQPVRRCISLASEYKLQGLSALRETACRCSSLAREYKK